MCVCVCVCVKMVCIMVQETQFYLPSGIGDDGESDLEWSALVERSSSGPIPARRTRLNHTPITASEVLS